MEAISDYQHCSSSPEIEDRLEKLRLNPRMLELGDYRILDITAAKPGPFAIPAHGFARIRHLNDAVEVRFLDSQWLRERLRSDSLPYFLWDKTPVMTVTTEQVQALVRQFNTSEQALGDALVLRPAGR
jgi:hypothetical protein